MSYQRIENLLEQESDVQDPAHPLPSIENGCLEYAIDRFAFEDEDTLRDIHFTLDKGKLLAWLGRLVQERPPLSSCSCGSTMLIKEPSI